MPKRTLCEYRIGNRMQPASLSALTISGYIVPLPSSVINNGFSRGVADNSALPKLARLTESVARGRAALSEQNERFDDLYRDATDLAGTPDEFEHLAEAVSENERRVAAKFLPR